jgi:hypothetical protein
MCMSYHHSRTSSNLLLLPFFLQSPSPLLSSIGTSAPFAPRPRFSTLSLTSTASLLPSLSLPNPEPGAQPWAAIIFWAKDDTGSGAVLAGCSITLVAEGLGGDLGCSRRLIADLSRYSLFSPSFSVGCRFNNESLRAAISLFRFTSLFSLFSELFIAYPFPLSCTDSLGF